jgi:hypothetical protein
VFAPKRDDRVKAIGVAVGRVDVNAGSQFDSVDRSLPSRGVGHAFPWNGCIVLRARTSRVAHFCCLTRRCGYAVT